MSDQIQTIWLASWWACTDQIQFLVSADRFFRMVICWLKGVDILCCGSSVTYNLVKEIERVKKGHLRYRSDM